MKAIDQEAYENYVNENYEKFNIITLDEYRHAVWYQSAQMQQKQIDNEFDYRSFTNELPNEGVMKSYQKALEYVNTEFVMVLDTDCVFLSKFKDTFDTIAKLYDENPDVMSISQLVGYSSNDIFKSNIVGTKNMPGENGGSGGPSPMCSTFRMEAWTKHDLCALCSRPGSRAGNGFIDFFLSIIGNGFYVMNFPFYSKDYIYHIGGGTARRNLGNTDNATKTSYGSTTDTGKYGARGGIHTVYDYYCGAHYVDMTSPEFNNYLKNKYNVPFEKIIPFDESILRKFGLNSNREIDFRPPSLPAAGRMEHFKGPRNEKNKGEYSFFDSYKYGVKKKGE